MKRNKFSKALKHLKSKKIDEKLKLLDEQPTNRMSSVYQVTPDPTGDGFRMGELDPAKKFYPKADGTWPAGIPADASDRVYVRGAGYHTGKGSIPAVQNNTPRDLSLTYMNANGNDTTTMIRASDGAVYADLPEGTRSFILGPLVTSYNQNHTYDDFTNLGYIQKDTRQFVLLARIQGFLDGTKRLNGAARTWDGTSTQFTSYNSNFKLEHALWMRDTYNKGNFTANVPYNLSGGVPADRHPDDAGKGSGEAMGTNGGPAGGDGDNTGQNQDPPDGNPGFPPEDMGYPWGQDPNDPPPTPPSRDDFPRNRNGNAAYRRARRKYEKDYKDWKSRQGKQPDSPKPTPKPDPEKAYERNRRNNRPKPRPTPKPDPKQDPKSDPEKAYERNRRNNRPKPPKPTPKPDPKPDPEKDYERNRGNRPRPRPTPTPKPDPTPTPKSDPVKDYDRNRANRPDMRGSVSPDEVADAIKRVRSVQNDPVDFLIKSGVLTVLELGNIVNKAFGRDISQGNVNAFKTMWQHHNNNNPTHPNFRKHDPSSDNYEGPADVPWDDKTSKEVTKNLDNALSKLNGGKGPKNPNGNLTPDEINQISQEMKNNYEGGSRSSADSSYYNSIGSLPPGETNFKVKNGKFHSFDTNYQFTDPRDANPIAFDDNFNDAAITNFVSGFLTGIGRQATTAGKPKGDGGRPYYKKDVNVHGTGSNNQVIGTQYNTQTRFTRKESYLVSSGDKRRILREVRQPLREIQELPKTTKLTGYRPNFKGKFSPQNTPDVTASKQSDDIVSAKNSSRQIWTAKDKFWKGYETTERMNIIYDNLGHGSQYFDRIVGENVRLKNKKSREVQEHLNMLAHQKAMREVYGIKEYENFIDESETFDNKINDPLFTKVAKRLKKEIDYPKKPAAKGYPDKAPPKIDPNTGMHPKYGKRYKYDKLDPISAKTMAGAPTGDPEIDANVKRQAQKEDWRSDLKNLWLGSERGDWKKKIEEDFVNSTQGMKVGQTFTHVPSGQTVTTSGALGGIETVPSTVSIFGDAIPGPNATQYGLQGFAKPIDMMRRGDKKAEQLNKELDSSEEYTKEIKADEFMKARVDDELEKLKKILDEKTKKLDNLNKKISELNKLAAQQSKKISKMRDDGLKKINAKYNERNNVRDEMVRKFEASFPSLTYNAMGNMIIQNKADSKRYDAEQDAFYAKVDATWNSMTKKIDAERKTFLEKMDNLYDSTVGKYNQEEFNLTQHELPTAKAQYDEALKNHSDKLLEKNKLNQEQNMLKGMIDEVTSMFASYFRKQLGGGLPLPVELTLRYAMGNMDPLTKSPGTLFNAITMKAITNAFNTKSNTVNPHHYHSMDERLVQAAYNNFSYQVTPNGIRVMDTFNFDDPDAGGATIGAFKVIPGAQWLATQLVKAGDRNARSKGIDPRDDRFGIKVDYTIPKSDLTPDQIKLFYSNKSKSVQKIKGLAGEKARKELSLDQPIVSPKKKKS